MAIKLDLEKAYDRLSWDFIDASFQATGVPQFLRKVIISTITSSTMQIMWNRVPTEKFKPNRGIRQGCPLSPYLFILCMEWLSHLSHSFIEKGWHPIRLSRFGLNISHLFFTDDLVIFYKVEFEQAQKLKCLLKHLCDYSRHCISNHKTFSFPRVWIVGYVNKSVIC